MAVTHPEKLVMAVPENRLDQIVDILTGSTSVAAAGVSGGVITPANNSVALTPVTPDYYYVKGIWSYDNGASWQEMGNSPIVATDGQNGNITLFVDVNSTTSADSIPSKILVNTNNNNYNTGYTILYKVVVMARKDQGPIGTKALIQPLRYSSKNKYMKVYKEDIVLLPTAGVTTIPHNLGYIPNVNVWTLYNTIPYAGIDSYLLIESSAVSVDVNNLYINDQSLAGVADKTAYYRIYLNA